MAILETSNGNKYQVNKKAGYKNGKILVDGKDVSILEIVTKKCKCVDNCKVNN
tara:strand:+ start:2289 stop:2447 length:159 start_codon:yes stop_codon:yes gene_type:complete